PNRAWSCGMLSQSFRGAAAREFRSAQRLCFKFDNALGSMRTQLRRLVDRHSSCNYADGGSMSKGRVLVIDDDARVRSQIRNLLEAHGYRVIEPERSTSALDDVAATTYDAVILDCGPRGGRALETIARIKENETAPPLIALWVPGSTDVSSSAHKAG